MRKILSILILFKASCVFGQLDFTRRVELEVKHVRLDDLMDILKEKYNTPLAFGLDNIPSDLRITLQVKDKTLYEVIQMICRQADLTFVVIDDVLVFKYESKASTPPVRRTVMPHRADSSNVVTAREASPQIGGSGKAAAPSNRPDSLLSSQMVVVAPEVISIDRSDGTVGEATQPVLLKGVERRTGKSFFYSSGICFTYSLDYYHFNFVQRGLIFQQFKSERRQSFRINAYIVSESEFYLSLGVGYATRNFILNYNYEVIDPGDPLPIPERTTMEIGYVELPLTLGYRILQRKKISVMIASGLYTSFRIIERETTTYKNQGNPDTNFFLNANRSSILGTGVSLIVNRSINRSWGLFVEPSALYFFDPINRNATHSGSRVYSLRFGIQFIMHNKR